jgi:hypothetical protein
MREFIQNPRRAPRAPARCRATIVSARGAFEAETEDIGPHGCRLASARLVRRGEPVRLELAHGQVKERLRLHARIAWTSDSAPWRLGVAFDEAAHGEGGRWFELLLSAVPRLSTFQRVPERIPLSAMVYLRAPPRLLVDLSPDELVLLRAIGTGVTVAELGGRMRELWPTLQRGLFSLLAHQHVTLSRGASVHPDAWRRVFAGYVPSAPTARAVPLAAIATRTVIALPMIEPGAWTRDPRGHS